MKSGHAPANLAYASELTSSFALLAFSKYRRAQIALLHAYSASFASAIFFYSSSLRRLSVSTGGLRLPLLQTYTALFASLIDFYSSSLRQISQVSGSDYPAFRPILPKILYYFVFIHFSLDIQSFIRKLCLMNQQNSSPFFSLYVIKGGICRKGIVPNPVLLQWNGISDSLGNGHNSSSHFF